MYKFTLFLLGSLGVFSSHLSAASIIPDKCSAALVPAIQSGFHSESDRLLFLYSLDDATLNKIQRNLDNKATILIDDLPINSDTKWQALDTQVRKKLENIKFETTRDIVTQWYSSKLTRENVAAYVECLKANAVGLTPYLQEQTGDLTVVGAVFHAVVDDLARRIARVNVYGSGKLVSSKEKDLLNGSEQTWTVQRTQSGSISVEFELVSAGSVLSSVTLPVISDKPKVYRAKLEPKLAQTLFKMENGVAQYEPGANVNYKDGPSENDLCYIAEAGWKIVKDTDTLRWPVQVAAVMNSGKIVARTNDSHVCYHLAANGDANGKGAGVAQIMVQVAPVIPDWVEVP